MLNESLFFPKTGYDILIANNANNALVSQESNHVRLKEQKSSRYFERTLLIKNFKYLSSLSIFVQKNNEAQRSQVSQLLTLTNNTTAEFDSGISYQGIEGKNNV